MNYYRRYVGDYLKKTIRLSTTEHGVYGLLLDFYYAEEKPIPLDIEEVYVICRAVKPDDQKAVHKVLRAYFDKVEDGWHNQRADAEIAAAIQARENGRQGGRPRKQETGIETGILTGIETGMGAQNLTGTGHPPTTNLQPPTKDKGRSATNKRGARLPEDWLLPKKWGEWALEAQPTWTEDHVRKVAANFKDHWTATPGARGTKLDWLATWRKWVRSEGALKGVNGARKPWFLSAIAIEAKGRELGKTPPESKLAWPAFRDEVLAAAGVTPEMLNTARKDFG